MQDARGPRHTSEVQNDERIIPDITDLDVPLVMGSRLRKPIKATQETAKVSWDREREDAMEDEDFPRAVKEMKRLEIPFFRGHRPRIHVDKGVDGTMVMSPEAAYPKMHNVRRAHVQNNHDVGLIKLVQNAEHQQKI